MGNGAIAGSDSGDVVDATIQSACLHSCGGTRSKSLQVVGSSAPKATRPRLTEEESRQRLASFERLAKASADHQKNSCPQTDLKKLAKLCQSEPARLEAPATDLRDTSCIIFDWDDTLFPTWYVEEVVKPTSLQEPSHMAPCFVEPMRVHAAAVKELLQTARKFARVAIVTLAAAPWIHVTSKKYWQDFDFIELCSELEIPIYYSRTFIKKAEKRQDDDGVDLFEAAKRKAMTKCLRTLEKKTGCMPSNNISIGDSRREHQALKDIMWEHCGYSFCKTVLFTEEPPIESLTDEVRIINLAIGRLVATQSDLELSTESAADLSSILSFAAETNATQAVSSGDSSAETRPAQMETVPQRDPKEMRALIRQYVKRGKPQKQAGVGYGNPEGYGPTL